MTGGKLIRPGPAEIEFKNMKFLITEQPHDSTIRNYITILKEHKVTHLVCATDPTYKTDDLAQSGVTFTELSFSDGSPPSQEIIEKWLSLVKKVRSVFRLEYNKNMFFFIYNIITRGLDTPIL